MSQIQDYSATENFVVIKTMEGDLERKKKSLYVLCYSALRLWSEKFYVKRNPLCFYILETTNLAR